MFGSLKEDRVNKIVAQYNKAALLEDNRKEIMQFADPRIRARVRRQNIHCRYVGMNKEGTMRFNVSSGTIRGHWWHVDVRFKNVQQAIATLKEKDPKIRDLQITRSLMNGDIELWCDCPAFTMWGWAYRATQRGYDIHAETRAPKRNLAYQGSSVCKHCACVLTALPFYSSKLVGEFRARGLLSNKSTQKDISNG